MSIVHSRFAEVRRYYQNHQGKLNVIPKEHAHPNFDYKERIALFHNGAIANFTTLKHEMELNSIPIAKSQNMKTLTDSQLIAALISWELDQGHNIKVALKNVVEKKLLGTYRIALMELNNPKAIYFVKNSGEFIIGHDKQNNEIIVSSESALFI